MDVGRTSLFIETEAPMIRLQLAGGLAVASKAIGKNTLRDELGEVLGLAVEVHDVPERPVVDPHGRKMAIALNLQDHRRVVGTVEEDVPGPHALAVIQEPDDPVLQFFRVAQLLDRDRDVRVAILLEDPRAPFSV